MRTKSPLVQGSIPEGGKGRRRRHAAPTGPASLLRADLTGASFFDTLARIFFRAYRDSFSMAESGFGAIIVVCETNATAVRVCGTTKKFGSLRKSDYLANQKYPRRSLRFLPVNDLCGGYAGQGSGSGEGGVEIDLNN